MLKLLLLFWITNLLRAYDKVLPEDGEISAETPRRVLLIIIRVLYCTEWSKVSVHLTITVQSSGAQRLFDHSV